MMFNVFVILPCSPQRTSKKLQKDTPEAQNDPHERPRTPRSDPRRHQELPGTPQERPRSAPRETKSRPRGPGDPKSAPRAPQERPRSHFGAFFEPPGPGFPSIFEHFGAHVGVVLIPPALLFCSVPLVLVLGAAQLIRVGGCPR